MKKFSIYKTKASSNDFVILHRCQSCQSRNKWNAYRWTLLVTLSNIWQWILGRKMTCLLINLNHYPRAHHLITDIQKIPSLWQWLYFSSFRCFIISWMKLFTAKFKINKILVNTHGEYVRYAETSKFDSSNVWIKIGNSQFHRIIPYFDKHQTFDFNRWKTSQASTRLN